MKGSLGNLPLVENPVLYRGEAANGNVKGGGERGGGGFSIIFPPSNSWWMAGFCHSLSLEVSKRFPLF